MCATAMLFNRTRKARARRTRRRRCIVGGSCVLAFILAAGIGLGFGISPAPQSPADKAITILQEEDVAMVTNLSRTLGISPSSTSLPSSSPATTWLNCSVLNLGEESCSLLLSSVGDNGIVLINVSSCYIFSFFFLPPSCSFQSFTAFIVTQTDFILGCLIPFFFFSSFGKKEVSSSVVVSLLEL